MLLKKQTIFSWQLIVSLSVINLPANIRTWWIITAVIPSLISSSPQCPNSITNFPGFIHLIYYLCISSSVILPVLFLIIACFGGDFYPFAYANLAFPAGCKSKQVLVQCLIFPTFICTVSKSHTNSEMCVCLGTVEQCLCNYSYCLNRQNKSGWNKSGSVIFFYIYDGIKRGPACSLYCSSTFSSVHLDDNVIPLWLYSVINYISLHLRTYN